MPNATFDSPDLTTFARLDELGLVAVGQRLLAERAVLECRLAGHDLPVPLSRAVRSPAHDPAVADTAVPV